MRESRGDVRIEVGGDNPGQIVVGAHNIVQQSIGSRPDGLSTSQWSELETALMSLASQVADLPPSIEQAEASKRVAELAEASTQEHPNVRRMSSVWSWFLHYAPSLMGAVATVVFHPVVGVLIRATGDALTEEFERQFGRSPGG